MTMTNEPDDAELVALIAETLAELKIEPKRLKLLGWAEREVIRAEENGYAIMAAELKPKIKAHLTTLKQEVERLTRERDNATRALKPFADRVFNDNGDMTINTASFDGDELQTAYFVHRRLAALDQPNGDVK